MVFHGCLLKGAILLITVINGNDNSAFQENPHLAAASRMYVEALCSSNCFANSLCSVGTLAIPVSKELLPLLS